MKVLFLIVSLVCAVFLAVGTLGCGGGGAGLLMANDVMFMADQAIHTGKDVKDMATGPEKTSTTTPPANVTVVQEKDANGNVVRTYETHTETRPN